MGLLFIIIISILAYLGYLIYKKELTWPIEDSIIYKKVLVMIEQANAIIKEKQKHLKTDEITSPKTEKTQKEIKTKSDDNVVHVPKPKGDEPVIEDRPNGKKEVVSGDKSILIDRIKSKHFDPVDQKFNEATQLREKYIKAKDAKSPEKNELFEKYEATRKEAEEMKKKATIAIFEEVNIYMVDEDAIDLHGLQIDGALDMVKDQINKRKAAGKSIVKVQCGMGHHNTVGFSKIKEAVVKYCQDEKLSFTEDKDHGFVNISL
ncbi:Smr domain containing protein [Entamoeba histolytica HM-1:IMSS-B]|uniref:Smr domain-containing protein n=6 Tax=Entamoeba histolytica TaxID=5759 RepID=C4M2C9_ENTH1|nr:hypothetical protein EHI_158100 [Entamoeba histolytica HM-1:IMSS]EMD48580.1 Smr domain containing protein [Entamoeba histolytica KU27]EMH72184.1 Smr domain containing protein [Entamoeba histolytica HM-1:IMSS-B]EMS14643.1 Smr domain containing protein [Entamoeba histolytica HM-3:IMSS]ENY60930.1 Smr domain containing protein [Entamoeba histolytica HM-1:IMSS-A]GAT95431.1 hypothetical protein CL6EHI_158100 [Entamoeba histolytica]|eukprot:XP_650806.1 hypothetical protein EHI_158100 [Entamoeba histolytica HM-1:IMSS]